MKLDLETLKHIKFIFELQSDHSTLCNGYKSLCLIIEEIGVEFGDEWSLPYTKEEWMEMKQIKIEHVNFMNELGNLTSEKPTE